MAGPMIFHVEGNPQGKARPRFTRTGHTFTPKRTVAYEERVRDRFLEAGGKRLPADCYVAVSIDIVFPIPKSYSKERRVMCAAGKEKPAKKPDIDNVEKVVLDALNGVAYEDDKQVTRTTKEKRYTQPIYGTGDYEDAGLIITITEDKA